MLCMKFADNSVQQGPQMKIVQLPIIACCRYLNLLFQNNCSVILMTALFQRISQPPGQDEQNCKQNSVNYHNSSSVLTSRMHPLRPTLQGFIFLHNSVFECSFKGCTFHHVWDNFQIYGAQITGKCICNSKKQKKKKKVDIFNHAPPRSNSLQGSFHHPLFPQAEGNYLFPPGCIFFGNLSSQQKGERGRKLCSVLDFFQGFSSVFKLSNFLVFIPTDSLKSFFLSQH